MGVDEGVGYIFSSISRPASESKEVDANNPLSRIVKRSLNYTSDEYLKILGHTAKKYHEEGSGRGSLTTEERRSAIVTANAKVTIVEERGSAIVTEGGSVLRAKTDAEQYLIDQFVERFEADQSSSSNSAEEEEEEGEEDE